MDVCSQGNLYKPENFDSLKKYPLIFDCYEIKSNGLHEYLNPDYTYGRINIPYYVSNGYLVFAPDIYYQPGHNGQGVMNAVQSAADYLSQFPGLIARNWEFRVIVLEDGEMNF